MKKFLILFFCLSPFFSPSVSMADAPFFSDDFSNPIKTNSQWENQLGNWFSWGPLVSNWTIESGSYKTVINQAYRASVTLGGNIDWDNYKIFADVKSGDGVDQSILFRVKDSGNFYGLDIRAKWNDQGIESLGNVLLFKWVNGDQSILVHYPYDIHNNEWYKIKIAVNGNTISILVRDKNEHLTPISFDYNDADLDKGKIGLQSWSGQFLAMYPSAQVVKYFDNILVLGMSSPDPIPSPTLLPPVVILPGLGASWNPAVLTGGGAPQSEWKIPWFVKHYEGLSDTLVNAGYTKGQNLFMFAYDWRKPIDQTADVLKNYLENVVEPLNPGLKTDLVGHSLGGLVARAYSQKYGISNVDKVVSVGSPHSGAIQSYLAWSGGEIKPDKLWQYFAFELLLQANKTGFQTDADVFRAKVPSIHDIMPTFNYLKKNTSPYPIIPLSSMNSFNKNFWLEDLNESVNSSFFDVFTAIEGNKGNTPEWYRVIKPNWWEKILDLWQDGKPTKTEFGVGDLAVLAKSGRINPDPFEQIDNANHTELITTEQGIQRIMDILGLTPSSIVTYPEFDFTPAILFASPSKIKLHITSPNGTFDSDIEKFVLLSNAPSGDYSVELIGDSDEIYSLFVGQETNSETYWNNYVGNLSGTGSEIYRFSLDTNNPNPNPLSDLTGVENLKAARSKLNTLPNLASKKKAIDQLDKIISLVVQGKKIQAIASFNLLIEKVFTYRKGATLITERNISFEALMDIQRSYVILTNLVKIPGLKEQAKVLIKAADSVYKATNKTLEELSRFNKISKTATASFANAENILNEAKLSLDKKDFNRSIILSQISIFLTKEAFGE